MSAAASGDGSGFDAAEVPIRLASTVILLRDSAVGPEVWLLSRVSQMVFAGGMSVFPGGRVDDADAGLPFADGPGLAAALTRLGGNEASARGLLGAAFRETFEETGVLLAPAGTQVGAEAWRSAAAVETGAQGFGQLLAEQHAELDVELLRPWARWITPAGERRRYDTLFFLAALPPGRQAADVTTESSSAGWVTPAAALAEAQRGERGLLPPTYVTLSQLSGYRSVAEAFAAAGTRDLTPVQPRLERGADGTAYAVLGSGERFALPASMFQQRPGT